MEAAISTGEDPLWIVPYTTIADGFQDLLQDYAAYVDVWNLILLLSVVSAPCLLTCLIMKVLIADKTLFPNMCLLLCLGIAGGHVITAMHLHMETLYSLSPVMQA